MINKPFKITLLTIASSIGFTACSLTPTQTVFPITQLEQVENIDALPDTKTNIATLSKYKDRCVIKFTGYLEGGESTETWDFRKDKLNRAFSETFHYTPNSPVNNTTQKPELDQNTRKVTIFDIQNTDVKSNFNKLKSHFNQSSLAQCH
ncbi:hypothetical protein EXE30_01585 [Acinetobacter halotolerans]|uniref:Uncharacterized protein n=1 Tax=Acinetobacter halotolerans TaxID=1752076 RepID=A0A4Q6XFD2_9GAMM|nr:hypothetical protein [Acinetobacter halotolerans]RZF56973.1 hypothetical protein EXE30_01585 [Acinetobacter halotolerans]